MTLKLARCSGEAAVIVEVYSGNKPRSDMSQRKLQVIQTRPKPSRSAGDTEFETFSNPSGTQFRGMAGLQNFRVLQADNNPFHILYDAYVFSLKLPPLQFALVVIALPLLMSLIFTGFYLFDMQGLVPDESVQTVIAELQKSGPRGAARSYEVFQVRATVLSGRRGWRSPCSEDGHARFMCCFTQKRGCRVVRAPPGESDRLPG
jgi:hypothetical protein